MKKVTTPCQLFFGAILFTGLLVISPLVLGQGNPWTTKNPMPTGRVTSTACEVNGKIYVLGGASNNGSPGLSAVEEYDPATDTWTTKANMPTARAGLSACVINGKIYAIGGGLSWGGVCVKVVEVYDPATDTWTAKANMPTARANFSTCVVNGKIYAIGGAIGPDGVFSVVEEYDPSTDTWTTKADMPTARNAPSASVVNGKVYVMGGALSQQQLTSKVEVYDPETNTWSDSTARMLTVRAAFATSVVNGKIYAFGGITSMLAEPLSTMEEYDPETDTWTKKTAMPTARSFFTSAAVNEKIYIMGGTVKNVLNISLTDHLDVYNPEIDQELPSSVKSSYDGKSILSTLHQNHPNPFGSATTIPYELSTHAWVRLFVCDLQGREIDLLVDGYFPGGKYQTEWNAGNMEGGMYLARLILNNEFSGSIKLLLQK